MWDRKKNNFEEVKNIDADLMIYDVKNPEQDCAYEKPEREEYSSETSITLCRIVFQKKGNFQQSNSRHVLAHKTGLIK
jgi:hypothetical protein